MATQKQIDANRRNARKSTGPKTPEGKRKVAANALRHGLTAATATLPGEDESHFDNFCDELRAEHQPHGPTEEILFQQLAHAAWRLRRCREIETGFFEIRLVDLRGAMKSQYTNLKPHTRYAYVFRQDTADDNVLNNLSRYEARAERAFYRALHELQRLQATRDGRDVPLPEVVDVNVTLTEDTASPESEFCQTNPIGPAATLRAPAGTGHASAAALYRPAHLGGGDAGQGPPCSR